MVFVYPRSSAKIRGKLFIHSALAGVTAPGHPAGKRRWDSYFGRAGAGHSGWQTPIVPPPTPKQQPHGRLQMSPFMHKLPHALIACVPLRNWCRESALAERAPINIVANKILLGIVRSPFLDQFKFGGGGGGPSGWQLPPVPNGL